VPALSLRFYRQASTMKAGFLPARTGIARSLLGLGLLDDADRAFAEILASRPDDLEARLGQAAVLGGRAKPKEEIAIYRTLLVEDEARVEVRAHLVAALIDLGDWPAARVEIEAMLASQPEDPQLRFLHAVALDRTGESSTAERERDESRTLGLTYEREAALCQHLGLPVPPVPGAAIAPSPPARVRAARPRPTRRTRSARRAATRPANVPKRAPKRPARSTRAASRKRK
jgi:predicted Zn-dependent protease